MRLCYLEWMVTTIVMSFQIPMSIRVNLMSLYGPGPGGVPSSGDLDGPSNDWSMMWNL